MTKSKTWLGLAIVAAVGTVAGLLLAPEKGQILRKKLLKVSKKITAELRSNKPDYSEYGY